MSRDVFRNTLIIVLFLFILGFWHTEIAYAGMPTPFIVLTEYGKDRLIGISTALFIFMVVVALPVMFCWNVFLVGKEGEAVFFKRLTYLKALGLTFLGVCLFTLVLVMIAGSRELFSPGAWIPDGVLSKTAYNAEREKLVKSLETDTDKNLNLVRRNAILKLREALQLYAKEHDGKLPAIIEESGFGDFWQIPFAAGILYDYFPDADDKPLVREPSLLPDATFSIGRNFEITEAAK
ncbi:MAG: hypothetical protein LBK82_04365 [Planctomycetaceae bacterium]|jgi:hypothetical protein|nr:hypothetical protein [Planctomycetaceae bacterium]